MQFHFPMSNLCVTGWRKVPHSTKNSEKQFHRRLLKNTFPPWGRRMLSPVSLGLPFIICVSALQLKHERTKWLFLMECIKCAMKYKNTKNETRMHFHLMLDLQTAHSSSAATKWSEKKIFYLILLWYNLPHFLFARLLRREDNVGLTRY